jgi:cyclophilin family peptidyl-prolyl cis-trans isomerase/HEAT repeat protein
MKKLSSRRANGLGASAGCLAFALVVAGCGTESLPDIEPAVAEASEISAARYRGALHEIRVIEDHRWIGSARLARHLSSPDVPVAEAALIAAGRIGDTGFTSEVALALQSPSSRVREAAAFAASLLGGDATLAAVRAAFAAEGRPSTRAALALALGRLGVEEDIARLAGGLAPTESAAVNGAAAQGLGSLLRRFAATIVVAPETIARLLELSSAPSEDRATAAAFALVSIRGAGALFPEAPALAAFARATSPTTRAYLARILRRIATPSAIQALVSAVATDPSIIARAEFARQLGLVTPGAEVLAALGTALGDPASQVAVAALQSVVAHGVAAASLAPAIAGVVGGSPSPWLRAEALLALVACDPAAARPHVDLAVTSTDRRMKVAGVAGLRALGTDADLAKLDELLGDPDPRVVSPVIDAIASFDKLRIATTTFAKIRAALSTRDLAVISSVATAAGTHMLVELAADLATIYETSSGGDWIEARLSIVGALGQLGDSTVLPTVTRALDDPERVVVAAAAAAYLALTGTDVSARIPLASRVTTDTPSAGAIARAVRSKVLLVTSRGPIAMRMLPDAPLSATNFVRLADRGFYDGLGFHRVVPDFVAQGGDPRGDGYGGSGTLIREEIGAAHRRGTVGMATAGKDTGSCQFFFNHGWNVHLDGAYTAFAEVTSGMDVADRLEVGDEIRAAYVD